MRNFTHPSTPIMSALKRFTMQRDPQTKLFKPTLPEHFQDVHAIADPSMAKRTNKSARDPYFMEGWEGFGVALCGTKVKVVLPVEFSARDPKACSKCIDGLAEHLEKKRSYDNMVKLARNYKSVKL